MVYSRNVELPDSHHIAAKGDPMPPINVPMLISIFEVMIENELAIAEFYDACAESSQKESPFWRALVEMERRHAEIIRRISEIVKAKPERFETGRPFNTAALRTIISYIKSNIADVKEGRMKEPKPFFLAMDLENSILETRYFEIVKSKDLEFLELSSKVMKETFDHRNTLKKKLDSLKASLPTSEPKK